MIGIASAARRVVHVRAKHLHAGRVETGRRGAGWVYASRRVCKTITNSIVIRNKELAVSFCTQNLAS